MPSLHFTITNNKIMNVNNVNDDTNNNTNNKTNNNFLRY